MALLVWIGLIVGNFLYQAFGARDFEKAAERSFFQGWAFVALRLIEMLSK